MAELTEQYTGLEEVPAHAEPDHGPGPLDVSGEMFLWTVGTFAVMAFALAKLAWRPMLEALDKREQYLRQSMADADRIEQEMAALGETRDRMVREAEDEGKEVLTRARKAAAEAERILKDRAREEAGIIRGNAEREIAAAREKAAAELRRDSVDAAIGLAGKLLEQNLDTESNRQLTDRLIGQL